MVTWIAVLSLACIPLMAFTKSQRHVIFNRDDAKCQDCDRSWYDGWMLECHHKTPLSCGGKDRVSNGVLVCRECHLNRHIRLFEDAERRMDERQMNANAQAIRLCRKIIRDKGLKRYGH